MSETQDKITLGFLAFPGFPMSCLTSAIEPLRAANEISGKEAFAWKVISETGARVESSAVVGFDPDLALKDVEKLDYLFLMSGPTGVFENPKSANGQLRFLARHGVTLGALSGGVFPLARSGVLEGHKCSVHWCYAASFATEFPEIEAVDDVIMVDRKRFTASGAAAAFDLMLQLIEVRLGESVATEVACWFQHPLVRGQGVRQKVPTIKSGSTADMLPRPVAAAITLFAENIDVPISVQEVAQEVGVSPRQLERGFKSATGQSPLQYYRSMRMNAARQMVMYSKDTMTEIAHAVGYASGSQLAAYYREVFGLSPQEDRRKINMFRVEENQSLPST